MGEVRLRRTVGPSTAVTLGLLLAASFSLAVFSGTAVAAPRPDPRPIPKPDPEPQPPPAPRPAAPPPPVYQAPPPPPPPPIAVAPPPAPSSAEIAAEARRQAAALAAQRRAARRAAAERKAARLAAARKRAARLAAQRRAAEERAGSLPLNGLATGALARPAPGAIAAPGDSGVSTTVVIVLGLLGAIGLALLSVSLVPVDRAPSYRMAQVLGERREQFAISGLACAAAGAAVSALVLLGG